MIITRRPKNKCDVRRLVSRANPSPREGRVWSTSHHGFVSVCHDFLGVLTTNDAHRRVVARAVLDCACARILTIDSVWRAPNSPARTASRLTANSIELLLTPCTACPFLSCEGAGPRDYSKTRCLRLHWLSIGDQCQGRMGGGGGG